MDDDLGWNLDLIKEIYNEDLVNAILNQVWPYSASEDKLFWYGNRSGTFTVRNYYAINTHNPALNQGIWDSLWKSKLHERLKMFLLCVLSYALPMKEALSRKFDECDSNCVVCGGCEETRMHLFMECSGFRALAFERSWGGKCDAWPASNIHDLVNFCLNPPVCKGGLAKIEFSAFVASLFYCFWEYQNECLYDGVQPILKIGKLVDQQVLEFTGILQYTSSFKTQNPLAKWIASALGVRKVNCDAAYVDGRAALEFVVRDEADLLVVAITKLLCLSSALEVEIRAIKWAIRCADNDQWRNFCFSSDAQVAVNDINSSKELLGWSTKDAILYARSTLVGK